MSTYHGKQAEAQAWVADQQNNMVNALRKAKRALFPDGTERAAPRQREGPSIAQLAKAEDHASEACRRLADGDPLLDEARALLKEIGAELAQLHCVQARKILARRSAEAPDTATQRGSQPDWFHNPDEWPEWYRENNRKIEIREAEMRDARIARELAEKKADGVLD